MLRTFYGIRGRYGDDLVLLCESRGDAEAIAEAMLAYGHDVGEDAGDYVREVRVLAQHPAESGEARAFLAGLLDYDEPPFDGGGDEGDEGGEADGE